jgi:two-component system nitrate/nitrite response regulator NarL
MDIAVLEPREVLRCGLASMLGRLGVVSRFECHHSISELLVARQAHGNAWNPDIFIVSCASNEDVVDPVRNMFPTSRVLELVASAEPRDLATAAKTRADGYLMLHDTTGPRLDRTLQALMRGELPIPQPIADYLFERARSTDASPPWIRPYFNASERGVIDLLLEGLSNRQIAQRLGISLHSAKRRVSAVLQKANSPSRAHFVAQMLRDGRA